MIRYIMYMPSSVEVFLLSQQKYFNVEKKNEMENGDLIPTYFHILVIKQAEQYWISEANTDINI